MSMLTNIRIALNIFNNQMGLKSLPIICCASMQAHTFNSCADATVITGRRTCASHTLLPHRR